VVRTTNRAPRARPASAVEMALWRDQSAQIVTSVLVQSQSASRSTAVDVVQSRPFAKPGSSRIAASSSKPLVRLFAREFGRASRHLRQ